jgi:hypothetical protein
MGLSSRSAFLLSVVVVVLGAIGCGEGTSSSSAGGGQGGEATASTGDASGSTSSMSMTTSSASTASGAGVAGACGHFCATLFELGCVANEAQCVDGCLIQSDGDPCPSELAATYKCVAEFATSCETAAPECSDEDLAYEQCLS